MHGFNWFALISDKVNEQNIHIITAVFVALLLIGAAILAKRKLSRLEQSLVPEGRFSVTNLFEVVVENLLNLMEGIIGPSARKHLPLIGALFLFIFTSNLLGLVPGFSAPTANINTNLAMALCVFFYFNAV